MTLLDAVEAQSTLRAVGSQALAKALITGINQADAEGHTLTEVQQIDLATMHIMAYDTIIEGCELLAVQIPQLHSIDVKPQT